MPKIITLFNHKGGVGKTTVAHNLGVSLTKQGKSVLLIDADPQMNLTSSVLGLADSVEYAETNQSKWQQAREKYTNITDYLNYCITKNIRRNELVLNLYRYSQKAEYDLFTQFEGISEFSHQNLEKRGYLDLLCGDINLFRIESLVFNIATNKINNRDNNTTIYSIEDGIRNNIGKNYDYLIIDTSPSASSLLNGIFVLMSDYFIAPVSPSFFSLQAIDNLYEIIKNWIFYLEDFRETVNTKGLSFDPKFLGIIVNMAKRYDGISASSKNWSTLLNASIAKFYSQIIDSKRMITESEFKNIFLDREPFIIEEICDYTPVLRSYSEYAGVPIIDLTQDMIQKNKAKVSSNTPVILNDGNNYSKAFKAVTESYDFIAKSIAENI